MSTEISPNIQSAITAAERFYTDGMAAMDELIIGERPAKEVYLAELAMGAENGMAALFIGTVGTGKSRIVKHGPRLVEDIHKEHIANVPHRLDLSPAQLVGDSSTMVRSGFADGEEFRETITGERVPIIRPGIRVVNFDEITRTSPLALNAALEITQNGGIEVEHDGKTTVVSGFDAVASSMNNHGTMFTNSLDPAVLSRHAMGAFTGVRIRGELSEAGEAIWNNPNKRYTGTPHLEPVIDLANLHKIRVAIDDVPLNREERTLGIKMQAAMLDTLEDEGLDMGDGRTADQLIRVARVLTMFNGGRHVTGDELKDAVSYAMTARLGGSTGMSVTDINSRIANVTGPR